MVDMDIYATRTVKSGSLRVADLMADVLGCVSGADPDWDTAWDHMQAARRTLDMMLMCAQQRAIDQSNAEAVSRLEDLAVQLNEEAMRMSDSLEGDDMEASDAAVYLVKKRTAERILKAIG